MRRSQAWRVPLLGAFVLIGLGIVAVETDAPIRELLLSPPLVAQDTSLTRGQVAALIADLSSQDPHRSHEAARTLCRAKDWAVQTVPALMRGVESVDGHLRVICMKALGEYGPAARAAVPLLVKIALDPYADSKHPNECFHAENAMAALCSIGMDETSMSSFLPRWLGLEIQGRGGIQVRGGNLPANDVLPCAIRLVSDPDPRMRAKAIELIGDVGFRGQDASRATPQMVAALADPDPRVVFAAASALGWMTKDATAVSALIRTLSNSNPDTRGEAASSLERIGPAAAAARDALVEHLTDPDSYARLCAARALGAVGGDRRRAAHVLVQILKERKTPFADQVPAALGTLRVASPEVIQTLIHEATSGDPQEQFARNDAIQSLGELGSGDARILEVLIAALGHSDTMVRYRAARAIIELGSAAASARSSLMRAAARDSVIREALSDTK